MPLESIIIFTDGSSRGNPGPGGFGAVIVHDGKVTELGGREERTTNNRMELQAAIEALSLLPSLRIKDKGLRITTYTDSSYLVNGITKWVHGWQKNGWKTKEKKDVENRDLWEKLIETSRNKKIQWKQIGGHVGIAGNHRCDEIATAFADGIKPHLYSGSLESYPIKNILDIAPADRSLTSNRERGQTSRKRTKVKAYSYVSSVDGVVQTHKTWAECEARVKERQAKYKKTLSAGEETELIAEWSKQR